MSCSAGTDIYSLSTPVLAVELSVAQGVNYSHVREKGDKVDTDWKTLSRSGL